MKSASRSNRNLGRFAIGKVLSESARHIHERRASCQPNAADDEAEGARQRSFAGGRHGHRKAARPYWARCRRTSDDSHSDALRPIGVSASHLGHRAIPHPLTAEGQP